MKKSSLIFVAIVVLLLLAVGNVSAQQDRAGVCHVDDDGIYRLIVVAAPAYDKHIAHGDAAFGDAVPGMAGYVFDENCQPAPGNFPSRGCVALNYNGEVIGYYNFGDSYYIPSGFYDLYADDACSSVLGERLNQGAIVYAPASYDALALCKTVDPLTQEAFPLSGLPGYDVPDVYACSQG